MKSRMSLINWIIALYFLFLLWNLNTDNWLDWGLAVAIGNNFSRRYLWSLSLRERNDNIESERDFLSTKSKSTKIKNTEWSLNILQCINLLMFKKKNVKTNNCLRKQIWMNLVFWSLFDFELQHAQVVVVHVRIVSFVLLDQRMVVAGAHDGNISDGGGD